jgi:hypothetical protein
MNMRETILSLFQDEKIRKDINDISKPFFEWMYNEIYIYLIIISMYCILIFVMLLILIHYTMKMSSIPLQLKEMTTIHI